MAQYKIHHTCGHSETRQLYGKTDARLRTIAFEEGRICRDCYNSQQAQNAESAGRKALTGSEKQIAWANGLRENAIARIDADAKSHVRDGVSSETLADIESCRQRAHVIAESEIEARWWIDNRDRSLFMMAAREIAAERAS